MQDSKVSLQDKYERDKDSAYMTGSQALVRALLEQRWLDEKNGLNTAGYISGYRGSPMTAMDVQLWREEQRLTENHIKFVPGINENMAMTSVWGTQQIDYFGDQNYDGVFAMWYGKGPGVDQTIDGLRQGNWHGSAKHGGALILAGDDPNMSSTINNYHSEILFEDLLMPVLFPADIQEVLDYALMGIALSRFSGAWVGYKLLPETIETSSRVNIADNRFDIVYPDYDFPEGGLNARKQDSPYIQEQRIKQHKLKAALHFARANNLNKITFDSENAKIGIVAMGKIWRDSLQSLKDLGLGESHLQQLGIRILKVSMPFPVDLQTYREFADGLEHVIVIEDKREILEKGIIQACYDLPEAQRPKVHGRYDQQGNTILQNFGNINTDHITKALATHLLNIAPQHMVEQKLQDLQQSGCKLAALPSLNMARLPYFCSGCPHNSSTVTPEGSRSFGGVGCHYMANWMDRDVDLYTHMGGEGATWIGLSPFVKTEHMFQNLGDGTYYHSGSVAVRAAIAAGINITYKILYNDAVAMTGGQPVDGPISVNNIAEQMRAEGVERIAIVSDDIAKYNNYPAFPAATTIHHRDDLNLLQQELRQIKGVSVLIYDQTCASEKRRRRKRGKFPDPAKRMFINDRVCEGCGDCGEQSNCLSVEPLTTEFGRKRQINQSTCNKDYRCNDGFCPSFVTVLGGDVKKGKGISAKPDLLANLPEPLQPTIHGDDTYNIIITGVGGTGVVTVGQILGMAAHIDDKGLSVVEQLGFAQKGGPVKSHVKIGNSADSIKGVRITSGQADLLLACDMLAGSDDETLSMVQQGRTYAVVNNHQAITGEFTRDGDLQYPIDAVESRLQSALGSELEFIEASKIATQLMGDAIAVNLFVVGYAWQKGRLPLSQQAIMQAIALNGVAVEFNQQAFTWGRNFAHDANTTLQQLNNNANDSGPVTLSERIALRFDELVQYQDQSYAERYQSLVNKVNEAEKRLDITDSSLTEAVAIYAYKLMAYKDEYEVARLYSSKEFLTKLNAQFEGDIKLQFNLSPPLIAPKNKSTGKPKKIQLGGWLLKAFAILAKFKGLRGSAFDIFGKTAERKMERALIEEYFLLVDDLLLNLDQSNYHLAVQLAKLPDIIRGYGHVKEANVEQYQQVLKQQLHTFKHAHLAVEAQIDVVNV
ncbi:indolepyruvate ferredoxin oxidoreductase family protein [Thalassotalea sp. Y01]|uniref:indolepyruvate ferredoxin oxidoreductase family protein n=1 Tax=Thalassotalea sp. Y01 TaxID=2729613 RepID=UPI00145F0705|nr:indolepyruvate ferredoxin oxidoreductase family protein [Thalassotalea sp. Y01]NMP14733.1 indolepyruvate ferredoxin oxidoreductase family protein [Thalassotalea sp. Y01]